MMAERHWKSVHVYYYDTNKDDLLLSCVKPLFASIPTRSFFVRHWIQGPHLRLRFECENDEQFEAEVRPLIEQQVGEYLKRKPSEQVLDVKSLLSVYKKLAKLEQENGPIWPLYPNNSIQYLPYDQRLHVLGSTLMTELIEDFYIETNELAFAILEAVRQGRSLHEICFDLMVTLAHVTGGGITQGYGSYRSHSEGFFMFCTQPQATRDVFEQRYAQQAPVLLERLPRLISALDSNDEQAFPFIQPFARILKRVWDYGEPLIYAGAIDMMYMANNAPKEDKDQFKAKLAHSAFHSIIEGSPEAKDALYANPWFQCYRLMLNLLYLHFNRLGIVSVERFQLCYFTANTVERYYDIDVLERMRQSFPKAS